MSCWYFRLRPGPSVPFFHLELCLILAEPIRLLDDLFQSAEPRRPIRHFPVSATRVRLNSGKTLQFYREITPKPWVGFPLCRAKGRTYCSPSACRSPASSAKRTTVFRLRNISSVASHVEEPLGVQLD